MSLTSDKDSQNQTLPEISESGDVRDTVPRSRLSPPPPLPPPPAAGGGQSLKFSVNNILSGNTYSPAKSSEATEAPYFPPLPKEFESHGHHTSSTYEVFRGWEQSTQQSGFRLYQKLTNPASEDTSRTSRTSSPASIWSSSINEVLEGSRNITSSKQINLNEHDQKVREPSPLLTNTSGYHSESSGRTSGLLTPESQNSNDSFSSDDGDYSSQYTNSKQMNIVHPLQSVLSHVVQREFLSASDRSSSPSRNSNFSPENQQCGLFSYDNSLEEESRKEEVTQSHDNSEKGLQSESTDQKSTQDDINSGRLELNSKESTWKQSPKKMTRRRRVLFTKEQTRALMSIFGTNRYIYPWEKDLIAKKVGLTHDQVKVWFQNNRYKLKKYEISVLGAKDSRVAASLSRRADNLCAYPRPDALTGPTSYNYLPNAYSYPMAPSVVPPMVPGMAPALGGRGYAHFAQTFPQPTLNYPVPAPYSPYTNLPYGHALAASYHPSLHQSLIRLS